MTQATSYKLFFISLAISLVALFLRIYELDAESLWLDEAYAVNHVADRGFLEVLSRSLPDGNPPLYYILLDHWIWLFGGSEYSVRMPSVLFSVFSVGLIYKVGSLLLDKATGLLASLIFALSAYQVHFAQEARVYSMMVFLCLSSFYFFLRLFQGKNYRIFAGYVLSSAALMYSHYFGLFIVIAQALFVWVSTFSINTQIILLLLTLGLTLLFLEPGLWQRGLLRFFTHLDSSTSLIH